MHSNVTFSFAIQVCTKPQNRSIIFSAYSTPIARRWELSTHRSLQQLTKFLQFESSKIIQKLD